MNSRVLIIGGQGRIGQSIAQYLSKYTSAYITLTSRQSSFNPILTHSSFNFLRLDLSNVNQLRTAIATADLVIHCAGPFEHRDTQVLKLSIEQGVNYIDVSDSPEFTRKALTYLQQAQQAGVTAIINTGIFPGISNSLVRLSVEELEQVEQINLSYVVGGSGGAGITVMRTTFLGLKDSFKAWIQGQWQTIQPYSDRKLIQFPKPYGKIGVYWFNVPETFTLAESFSVQSVITKFGSFPDLYNYLTWGMARGLPTRWLGNSQVIEFLSRVSYAMTQVTDRWSGIGVAIRATVTGFKHNQRVRICASIAHQNTAIIAGIGTGTIAEWILKGQLNQPGVWPVERVLPTDLFQQGMNSRDIKIDVSSEVLYN